MRVRWGSVIVVCLLANALLLLQLARRGRSTSTDATRKLPGRPPLLPAVNPPAASPHVFLGREGENLTEAWLAARRAGGELAGQAAYEHMFDADDELAKRSRYPSCAVVGSSGKLLGCGAGGAVDAAAAVFRVNTATVRGHEPDVGGRTTLRIINSRHVYFHEQPEEIVVLSPDSSKTKARFLRSKSQRQHLDDPHFQEPRKGAPRTQLAHSRWFMLTRHFGPKGFLTRRFFGGHLNSKGNPCKPTTGLVALLLAMELCGTVQVWGFDSSDEQRRRRAGEPLAWPYHYHDNQGVLHAARNPHCFDVEAQLLASLNTSSGSPVAIHSCSPSALAAP